MPGNSFGTLLKLTSWGESHGPAVGGVLDGCPAGMELSEIDLQKDLDRRKPGQSKLTTQRKEPDKVKILSGLFEGKTTGTPIAFIIENEDKNSSAYDDIKDKFRPGHADYSYHAKYGIRDHRGGGRSSARETAVRVAAGAIAKKILGDIRIIGFTMQIGDIAVREFNIANIEKNLVRCPDAKAALKMEKLIDETRKAGDSIGGIVEIRAVNVPAGLGEPVYGKLDGDLASALVGINAVKGVEFGDGFGAAFMKGSEHNDEMVIDNGKPSFKTDHSGGIIGGISTGQEIIARIAVKPTPSIIAKQDTININGEEAEITVEGRHDPCICPRVIPVAEAMMALVLADHFLLNKTSRVQ